MRSLSISSILFLPTICAFAPVKLNHPRATVSLLATIPRADEQASSSTLPSVLSESEQVDLDTPTFSSKIVKIDCQLTPVDFVPQPLFDGIADRPQRLEFVLDGGNYLPGLHELARRGERARSVPLDAGWGPRNPNLVANVASEALGEAGARLKVGTELVLGAGSTYVVTAVEDNTITLDGNPPLAGATYLADVDFHGSITLERNRRGDILAEEDDRDHSYEVATFALGCFWGAELAYLRYPGVVGTRVGYTQGSETTNEVTYEDVCTGMTGHAEVVQLLYDSTKVSYGELTHYAMEELLGSDKYKLNQVKGDRGTQYRHGLYYHDEQQRDIAQRLVRSYGQKCVTEIKPAATFFDAEPYHQQYLFKGGQSARKGDKTTIRCYG